MVEVSSLSSEMVKPRLVLVCDDDSRRRAGSESYVEEPLVPGTPAQQPTHQPSPPLPPGNLLIQGVAGVNSGTWGSPADQAYYKKTDSVNLGSVGISTAHPWSSQPPQPYLYPSQGVNTSYPSGTLYATETSQWNNSGANWNCGSPSNRTVQGNNLESGGLLSYSNTDCLGGTQLSSLDDSNMASRDRTQEFARIVRSQQGSYSNGAIPHHEGSGRETCDNTETSCRDQMAKKRSLFDDSHDREIQELTGIIRHDLSSLTKQLTDLRNRSQVSSVGGNSAHIQKHSTNLVGTLQTKVALITQKFKDILEVRTENLKKQAERREQFTGGVVSGELPPGAVAGHHQGSVLLADEAAAAVYSPTAQNTASTNGEVAINLGSGSAYQQQLHLMEEQDTYLQSRADTMHTIESTIVELGQMFSQLATMVKEQEELVHRIDANVEDAELNVEAAHSELLKYFKSVSSNRMLMIKVFGIMIVFFVIFIVFMA